MCITYVISMRGPSINRGIPLNQEKLSSSYVLLINSNLISMDSDVASFS